MFLVGPLTLVENCHNLVSGIIFVEIIYLESLSVLTLVLSLLQVDPNNSSKVHIMVTVATPHKAL